MPVARILSRNFGDALRFSEQLRTHCSEIEIEIGSPDQDYAIPADLEIVIDSHSAQQALWELCALADKERANVFVAPGTLIPPAESDKAARVMVEKPRSTAPSDSESSVIQPTLETTLSGAAKAYDTVQQLWWRYRLLTEIHALQRERLSADAKRVKQEERERARAAKAARRQARRLEEAKQAILEAFLQTDPSTAAAKPVITEDSWQGVNGGPELTDSPSPTAESRNVRKRARRTVAGFAVAVMTLCAAGTFSYVKRRPASPLPNETIQRSEGIEEQVPFGSATASSPQVTAMVPSRVEAERGTTGPLVEHLQNGEEVHYLGDDVTVRYFPAKRKKNERQPRHSQPGKASVTKVKAGASTIAHNGGTATIRQISDMD